MAQFEKWFTQDLTQNIEIRHCEQITFTGDNLSNMVGVNLFVDGKPYDGGGDVTATVVLSNGATVALENGVLDGNKASVTLTSGCFICPGLIGVYIRLTNGDVKTTVLSAVFTVIESETGSAVDPGTIIPSVQDLIDDIADAVATIPPDYSALLATIAPTFSESTAYSGGSYVWYDSVLYRFKADHAAGAWTGTDAVSVVIGDDLSKAVTVDENSPDWLYKQIFGDDSDWFLNLYDSFPMTKTGRLFTIKGNGNSSTSVRTVNLTGTTHTERTGNWESGNAPAEDADFITIPEMFLKNKAGEIGFRTYWNLTQLNVNTNYGFTLGIILRRLNTDTQEYEYSDRIQMTNGFAQNGNDTTACVLETILVSGANDRQPYDIPWEDYTEMAIYLVRRNRVMRGTLVIEPFRNSSFTQQDIDGLMLTTGFTDYGYRWPFIINPTDNNPFTMRRNGVYITISTTETIGGTRYCRLTDAPSRVTSSSSLSGWPTGVMLKSGHLYIVSHRLVSGTASSTGSYPYVSVYPYGGSSTLNIANSGTSNPNSYWRVFRAGDVSVNLSFNIPSGVTLTNAVYEILLRDISETGEDVAGLNPVINAAPGWHYNCTNSYVETLTFTPCGQGLCSVRFKSGTTATVLTLPNTVKMPDWWTGTEANRTYEISIADGQFGVVTSWA